MCIFSHIAAGGLAGALSPNPYAAPFFGLGSHILLDIVPHHDLESMKLEIGLGIVTLAVIVLGGAHSPSILVGALFGILPDLENLLWKTGRIGDGDKIFPGHAGWIRHGRQAGPLNLVAQFVLSAAAVGYLLWRHA